MVKEGPLRPHLKKQIIPIEPEDWQKVGEIAKRNTSKFFSYLYAYLYNGTVLKELWGGKGFNNHGRNFNPDIVRTEDGRKIYTEDKVTSVRSSQIHSPVVQEENALYYILEQINQKRDPLTMIEYSLFRYGPWSTTGLHRLGNSELVRTLAGTEKKLVILPLNAFLYAAAFSRHEKRDQKTSGFGRDTQDYHVLNGRIFKALFENNRPIQALARYPLPDLDHLLLGDLKVEHYTTPEIEGFYRKNFTIKPFQVTRYYVPAERYEKLAESLMEHHQELTGALGIKDAFQIMHEPRSPLPF